MRKIIYVDDAVNAIREEWGNARDYYNKDSIITWSSYAINNVQPAHPENDAIINSLK